MRIAVLRPEPVNAATAARAEALGIEVVRLPLFAVRPLPWEMPNADDHDALLLTSANAVRQAGDLEPLRRLPVLAVGAATAAAARGAGFTIARRGTRGARELLDEAPHFTRILYLAGRERTVEAGGGVTAVIAVYASDPVPVSPEAIRGLADTVVLLHSARAAARLAELADSAGMDRALTRIAVLSAKVATAAGAGWRAIATATSPNDDALLAATVALGD